MREIILKKRICFRSDRIRELEKTLPAKFTDLQVQWIQLLAQKPGKHLKFLADLFDAERNGRSSICRFPPVPGF
jgi:hypothetical protein